MSGKEFYIKTFGCQMNERDSEIMAQVLSENGYIEGMEIDKVDLVILNTCSIRAKAEQKVMSLLGQLRKQKIHNPQMQICVAGCVAQQEGKRLLERMGHVDLVIGTQHIYNIGTLLADAARSPGLVVVDLQEQYRIPGFVPDIKGEGAVVPVFRKFVTIMQGCNNYCTYCVVPYTRGREVSRNIRDIVDEVNVLVDGGVKEITLLGQNVNSYGMTNQVADDGAPCSFPRLLHTVANIAGLSRLRFTTSNPKDLSEELMQCFQEIDILCPQFHLPVQAGANSVLKRMNRKYTVEQYLEKVQQLRHYCPEIALTTDIIVGFPGESEEDFLKTMDLLETVRFHGSFSFKYSDRPGTRACDYSQKISEEVKAERLARFQARQDQISLERNREYIGQVKEIMIEEKSSEGFKGRTTTNHIVHVDSPTLLSPGDLTLVKIIHAGQHSLKGEISR